MRHECDLANWPAEFDHHVSPILNCSASKAWNEVQKSSLLLHVIWPLARVVPTGTSFPERWSEASQFNAGRGLKAVFRSAPHRSTIAVTRCLSVSQNIAHHGED